ncbi:MAG TPA: class I SAM-dependent methyltransferase [Longimicrobium sp.]|jgi:SAM-dependent methyltransferase
MHASPDSVRDDFDHIARLTEEAGEPGRAERERHEDFLLRHVPRPCDTALEIGCGTGELARRLAGRAGHVLAVDLSPEMIRIALERSAGHPNVEYRVADVTAWPFAPEGFDCIATVATLHHLPAAQLLRNMKESLRPGGVLLVQDVLDRPGLLALPRNAVALAVRHLRRIRSGERREPAALRAAWARHGSGESYLRMAEVRSLCAAELPGALIHEHLLWRFSIVWRKPA